jgi:uncharacterized protein (TIGR03435 family)
MRNMILASLWASTICGAFGQAPAPRVEFEVASVKPSQLSNPNGERNRRENITADPGSLTMRNISLKSALQWAYGVNEVQVSGPGWMADERYDILAKAAVTAGESQLKQMLQALLTDRFKMTVHHETKVLSMYALLVDKNGLKLAAGDPAGKSSIQPDSGPNATKVAVTNMSMQEIADMLTMGATRMLNLPEPVVDQTGLKGRYSFALDAAAFMQKVTDAIGAGQRPDPDVVINAVQEVLQKQMGLRAELRKAPMDMVVVDRAEKVPVQN